MSTTNPVFTGSENKVKKQIFDPRQALGGNPEYDDLENDSRPKVTQTVEISSEKNSSFSASGSITFVQIEGHHAEQSVVKEGPVDNQAIKETVNYVFNGAAEGLSHFGKMVMLGAPVTLKDVGDAGSDLVSQITGLGQKTEAKSNNPKQQEKKAQEAQQKANEAAQVRETSTQVLAEHKKREAQKKVDQGAEQTNKLNIINNLSYQGTTNRAGEAFIYHQLNATIKQEEITKEQREKARSQALAQATRKGKGKGPDLNQNTMGEKTAGNHALNTVG